MTQTPAEPGLADALNEALISFTGCIGEALEDICSYGLTIGDSYVPFDPDPEDDCEEDEAACSQAWVRVVSVTPSPVTPESWNGECASILRVDLEVGVLRCLEIPEGGEAPTASDVMVAAMQSMADMKAIHCAALGCEVWEAIEVGSWSPTGPLGGQYGGIWSFSVDI